MRNHNNEFILIIYIARIKMVDFKCRELKIGLEFGHISFDKRKNLSEGSSERKEYAQVIWVRGAAAPRVFNSNYLFYIILGLKSHRITRWVAFTNLGCNQMHFLLRMCLHGSHFLLIKVASFSVHKMWLCNMYQYNIIIRGTIYVDTMATSSNIFKASLPSLSDEPHHPRRNFIFPKKFGEIKTCFMLCAEPVVW